MAEPFEAKVRRTYDRIADAYHKARVKKRLFFNEFLEMPATLSVIGNVRGKRVLDLGCGPGVYSKILKRIGAEVYGLDLSPKAIDIAKREVKGVDFSVGSAYKLPYKSRYFDLVVASLVMEYLTDLDKAFMEVNRVLKYGGVFVFSMHNPVVFVTRAIRRRGLTVLHRRFSDYFDENVKDVHWNYRRRVMGKRSIRIPAMHTTYQTLIKTFLSCGFILEDYIDAKPLKSGRRVDSRAYALTSRVPYFCVFKVKKT